MIRELAAISPHDPASNRSLLNSLSLCADWIEHRYKYVTSAYTLDNETVIGADATGGAFAVNLPPSDEQTINRAVVVKRLNAGANAVTVTPSGSDTIDGAATYPLTVQYQSVHIIADGLGAWFVI